MNVDLVTQGFLSSFQFADFLDVIIIAILVYSGIIFFKQTRSLLVLTGIGIILGLYGFARVFNLYLTTIVFQSFFSVFLVILAVVFQDEIRRYLEFIASLSTRQRHAEPLQTNSESFEAILQAIAHLAHQKHGALIVIRGHEPIDRHLEGGSPLDGVISEELIESIFDPTSPGHDGAIVINRERIATMGTHLPLSNNFPEIGKHGTRHSAALGIAERTDAFAIVVSEEQGTISIARDGKLETCADVEALRQNLNGFLKIKWPEETYRPWERIIKQNSVEKIIATGISVSLWFFVALRADIVQREFTVPIAYQNVPENIIVEEARPKEITVTLEGRGTSAFEQLVPEDLGVILDGQTFQPGTTEVTVGENMITHPNTFSVIKIRPQKIKIITRLDQQTEIKSQNTLR
ncbi:MAG: diadenylate cyclase [Patescibacteria group bacterium]